MCILNLFLTYFLHFFIIVYGIRIHIPYNTIPLELLLIACYVKLFSKCDEFLLKIIFLFSYFPKGLNSSTSPYIILSLLPSHNNINIYNNSNRYNWTKVPVRLVVRNPRCERGNPGSKPCHGSPGKSCFF